MKSFPRPGHSPHTYPAGYVSQVFWCKPSDIPFTSCVDLDLSTRPFADLTETGRIKAPQDFKNLVELLSLYSVMNSSLC